MILRMLDIHRFINQSLSPVLVISATGLLTLGLTNRLLAVAGRLRGLNAELRQHPGPERVYNLREQINYLFKRLAIIKNALVMLYSAMGCMVFTCIAIALQELEIISANVYLPVWTFLGGLLLMLGAVVMEAVANVLNLKTLELDSESLFEDAPSDA